MYVLVSNIYISYILVSTRVGLYHNWVSVKMVRSAANHLGNVREFHSVCRVVILVTVSFTSATCHCDPFWL